MRSQAVANGLLLLHHTKPNHALTSAFDWGRSEHSSIQVQALTPGTDRAEDMATLASAVLKDKEGKEVPAAALWEKGPVLVVVLRRPGCRECWRQAAGPCTPPALACCSLHPLSGIACRAHQLPLHRRGSRSSLPQTQRAACPGAPQSCAARSQCSSGRSAKSLRSWASGWPVCCTSGSTARWRPLRQSEGAQAAPRARSGRLARAPHWPIC